jgi:hypothetical protein
MTLNDGIINEHGSGRKPQSHNVKKFGVCLRKTVNRISQPIFGQRFELGNFVGVK